MIERREAGVDESCVLRGRSIAQAFKELCDAGFRDGVLLDGGFDVCDGLDFVIEERIAAQHGLQVCDLLIGKAFGHCRGWDAGRNVSRLSGGVDLVVARLLAEKC